MNYVFLNTCCKKVKNFSGSSKLYKLQTELGLPKMSLTTARKATATKANAYLSEKAMDMFCEGQSHSRATTERFYVAPMGPAKARAYYEMCNKLRVTQIV